MHDTRYDGDTRRDALASVSIMRTRSYTLNPQKSSAISAAVVACSRRTSEPSNRFRSVLNDFYANGFIRDRLVIARTKLVRY